MEIIQIRNVSHVRPWVTYDVLNWDRALELYEENEHPGTYRDGFFSLLPAETCCMCGRQYGPQTSWAAFGFMEVRAHLLRSSSPML